MRSSLNSYLYQSIGKQPRKNPEPNKIYFFDIRNKKVEEIEQLSFKQRKVF